jgi:hypothetical protein
MARSRQRLGTGARWLAVAVATCGLSLAGAEAAMLPPGDAPADSVTSAQEPAAAPADSATSAQEPAAAPADTAGIPEVVRESALTEVDLWHTGVSPTLAVVMTPVYPGWGQLYARNSWRGALAFGLEWFYWSNMIARSQEANRIEDFGATLEPGAERDFYATVSAEKWEQVRDFAWWSAGILLIIALDAYVGAHLFEFDRDAVPVPNRWDQQFGPLPERTEPSPSSASALSMVLFQWRKSF